MSISRYVIRAYRLLDKHRYRYDLVERQNSRISKDFCGFADIIAFRPITFEDLNRCPSLLHDRKRLTGALAIQVCRYCDFSLHLRKVSTGECRELLIDWLCCDNRFEVWAFSTPANRKVKGKSYPPKFRQFSIRGLETLEVEEFTELSHFGY